MPRTPSPQRQPSLTDRVNEMRNELDETENVRKRDVAELRDSLADNTASISRLTDAVAKISENINGFSMESFSDTLDKLVMLIDGDDSRDVTGLRKRVRTVEEVQASQNKSLERIETKLNRIGVLVFIASVLVAVIGDGGAVALLEAISKLFVP